MLFGGKRVQAVTVRCELGCPRVLSGNVEMLWRASGFTAKCRSGFLVSIHPWEASVSRVLEDRADERNCFALHLIACAESSAEQQCGKIHIACIAAIVPARTMGNGTFHLAS